MDAVNNAFYNITDKIIGLQSFFINFSNKVAYVVLLIAICMAAINYAMTGTGLKENIIKISKAFVFFTLVISIYPKIIGFITEVTFSLAKDSTAPGISSSIKLSQKEMEQIAMEKDLDGEKWTYGTMALRKYDNFFTGLINNRTYTEGNGKSYSYSTVAPTAAMKAVLLVAGECMRLAEEHKGLNILTHLDTAIPAIIKGYVCAFFLIVVGCFCLLEYLIAFIEFMLVSSVGVIMFPLSLWEGTKFATEGYIKSMLGFFVKLLFCTICIFLMLWVFTSLAAEYTKEGFFGNIEQMATITFTSLLTLFVCKSAPALAQGLLSGSPSLTGAGAIGMVASAVMMASKLSGISGGHSSQSMQASPSPPPAAVPSGSGGVVASQPPPQAAPSFAALSAGQPSQPYAAIEDRSDLTRSLAYNNRPLLIGPGGATAAAPPPSQDIVAEQYNGNRKGSGSKASYEILG